MRQKKFQRKKEKRNKEETTTKPENPNEFIYTLNLSEEDAINLGPNYVMKILYLLVLHCTRKIPADRVDVDGVIIVLREVNLYLESLFV